ncbi:RNB domain-containing ribonuclease [Novosphingobium profundi]|uniref:RNB domain-containing ribonuclease n=1 Tax=Novosphingobium profundi TaxID=1774954 RepID=UPI001BDA4720|nr:RNB domain-containing ribonuclease [Novosphingobium profundi]MBT0671206.1 RNB domain-containing ribonuclease [Novosphingobium profundi]
MRALHDPAGWLANGLSIIRERYAVPTSFPKAVLAAAEVAARRAPSEHIDRTARPFVTLDPASSTDLDQAFAIEAAGSDWLLHYAIADVAWFVTDGDPLDQEAWKRGTTCYLPDGKANLYPPLLSERCASLLPDGDRPALILSVRIAPDGRCRLDGVERALIRSRAKLGYETVRPDDLPPGFDAIVRRLTQAEQARGASRIDPPEQQLEKDGSGTFRLGYRLSGPAEEGNAALSLAANLAVAQAMLAAQTGLFRTMPAPDAKAEQELRATAQAFGVPWPETMPLAQLERRLDPRDASHAALMMAIRRAGHGASYSGYHTDELPWHAAIGAPYAHATAPLRRLADRYVLRTVHALAQGKPIPAFVRDAFETLPPVMARAGARDAQIERAVIDLAEATMLEPLAGCTFAATVTDRQGERAQIQLNTLPVIARLALPGAMPGDPVRVRLRAAYPLEQRLEFEAVD